MKSLHLTNSYHPTSGGIRTWYHEVLAAGGDAGWDVRLVVPADRSWTEQLGAFARIHHVKAPRAPAFDRRYRLLLPHRYLLPGGAIRRILLAESPDVVEVADKYTLNWLAGVVRKGMIPGLKRPLLIGFSFERMDDNVAAFLGTRGPLASLAPWYMSRFYVPMFDVHLAPSGYTADELTAAGAPPERVHVQPLGLDTKGFGPEHRSDDLRRSLLEAAGGSHATTLLLYAGRLSPEKNVELLLRTMRELASGPGDYRLIVAGGGPLAERIRAGAGGARSGSVLLWGHVRDRGALAALYATCDVFVHPNPREPFGIGPLEAMASGVPIVLPDAGGVLTYADGSNAWLARPEPRAFADAVRGVAADPALARARAARARDTASRYATGRMVRELFALYTRLLTGSPPHDDRRMRL